ncbi:hypothetical protein GYH30_054938 [Glycine max]|nr:hypothetical protein GYH30_054938 [Glycine max]
MSSLPILPLTHTLCLFSLSQTPSLQSVTHSAFSIHLVVYALSLSTVLGNDAESLPLQISCREEDG